MKKEKMSKTYQMISVLAVLTLFVSGLISCEFISVGDFFAATKDAEQILQAEGESSVNDDVQEVSGYAVGDIGPAGGLIFYVDEVGDHSWTYLEAAPGVTEVTKAWKGAAQLIGGDARSPVLGAGQAATAAIVSVLTGQGVTDSAAQYCDDLAEGGYTDWFLPSLEELQLMCTNLYVGGVGNFQSSFYLSSTEMDDSLVCGIEFSTNNPVYRSKMDHNRVRAIRSF